MVDACTQLYIDGHWVSPQGGAPLPVINPATEQPFSQVANGSAADVDLAVAAARRAFPGWSTTDVATRVACLEAIVAGIEARHEELAIAITTEMGAPLTLARAAQVSAGLAHFKTIVPILRQYAFETRRGTTTLVREPVGVCGLITPWNWPLNQIACKVAPALAAGCTVILKPSELAPVSATLLAEIIHAAGVPAGVFNLVHGTGPTVGAALTAHPDVDLISFTGSTRAGREVSRAAADTVKRVCLELGGKSANIILDDAPDFAKAVTAGTFACFNNSGQSCNAPTRMLVPKTRLDEAITAAKAAAARVTLGDPMDPGTRLGPVVSAAQFQRITALIEAGIAEGAQLVAGGPGRPAGLDRGYFIQPTVFAGVHNDMTIAREEIFGPVLCLLTYGSEAEAIDLANDSDYGLSGYVSGAPEHARAVARRLRTGMVHVNGASLDFQAPFGGYRQSGHGREWGVEGFEEFLEIKAVMGDAPAA